MRLPNGYGSVYKDKAKKLRKRWIAVLPAKYVNEDGKVKKEQKRLGSFSSRLEAMRALEVWHLKYNSEATGITLADAYNKWFLYKSKANSAKWASNTKSIYKIYLKPIELKRLKELDESELQKIIDNCGKGWHTKSDIKQVLSGVYDYAKEKDWIRTNIAKYLSIPENDQTEKLHKNYTIEEIQALWREQDLKSSRLALFLIYTGLRFNEVLKITEVNLEERYIITGSKTKAGKNRLVPIHKDILPFLIEFKDTLFKTNNNNRRRIYNQNRKGHTPHDCRYTFTWLMNQVNIPPIITIKILGQEAGNTMQDVYLNLTKEELISAVDKINIPH